MFTHGFHLAMNLHCKFSAPYLYEFSYEGSLNVFRNLLSVDHVPGACHADELGYLFKMDLLPSSDSVPSEDLKMRETFVKMWANFIHNG